MGTTSAAAIAVSISARLAMLLASSSGSSSLSARPVQSRAARCASVVIIEGFLLYLQRCSLLGQVRDTKKSTGCGQHIRRYRRVRHRARSLWPANRQRVSLVLGKPRSTKDRWRRATIMHAAGPLVLETLAVSHPT